MGNRAILPKALFIAVVPLASLLVLAAGVAGGPAAVDGTTVWLFETVDERDNAGRLVSLGLDASGLGHLVYIQSPASQPPWPLEYARQDEGGWTIETIDPDGGNNSLAVDGDGVPHVSFYHQSLGGLAYANRKDGAWQVETVDAAFGAGGLNSLALDSAGRPHILYSNWETEEIRYAHWTGREWVIEPVLTSYFEIWGLDLALDNLDRPHFVFHEIRMELYDFMTMARYGYWDGADWHFRSVWSAAAPNDGGDVGFGIRLALDGADRPHIALLDVNNWSGHLVYLIWNGSYFEPTYFGDDSSLGAGLDLVLDAAGRPHIMIVDAFFYNWAGLLKYFRWTGGEWLVEGLPAAGLAGYSVALALDGERPVAAFDSLDNNELTLAREVVLTGVGWLPLLFDE